MKTIEELREREEQLIESKHTWEKHVRADTIELEGDKATLADVEKQLSAVRAEIAAAEKAAKLDALRKKFPKGTRVRVTGTAATIASGVGSRRFGIGAVGTIDDPEPYPNGNLRVVCKNVAWAVHPDDLEVIPEPFSPPNRITHSDQLKVGMRVKYHLPSGASNATIKVLKTTGWEAVVEFGYGYLSTDNTNEHFNIAAPGSPTIPITEKDNWVERVEDARACPLGDYPVCCPKARCPHA